MKQTIVVFMLVFSMVFQAQNIDQVLPYNEIPEYSETYTAGSVAARMVDGLGFRFYWASEGLTDTDLEYRLNADARSTSETIDHILSLSYVIVNSTLKKANGEIDVSEMSFSQKRAQVLMNLKTAADILRNSDNLSQFKIIFGEREFPFWNQINGPIADAIWHCGQVASFRRISGNPINSKISHFTGTVKD
jgi:hypothetical protein